MERDLLLADNPLARETLLDGQAVTIRYGGHPADPGSGTSQIKWDAPMRHESVQIVFPDGRIQGATLPRDWREWTDDELIEKLPMCNLLGFWKPSS